MPTVPKARLALLVVGVGRSGTSLTMQALELLGVGMPSDPNPPDENNLRGTGEDRLLEKRVIALRKALGGSNQLLPNSWRNHPTTQEMFEWLKEYIAQSVQTASSSVFAMKHPFASDLIPLFIEAAEAANVRLRVVWATRAAADATFSRMRRFETSTEDSLILIAMRSFYILRDAPADTLLLPYEGWHADPARQVSALAEVAEVSDPAKLAKAREAFAAHLDHGQKSEDLELPPALRRLEEAVAERLGRLGDVLPQGSPERLSILAGLGEIITEMTRNEPGSLTRSDDAVDVQIELLKVLSASNTDETRMKNEIDILTQRIREVHAENRKLRAELAERDPAGRRGADGAGKRSGQTEEDLAKRKQAGAELAEVAELRRAYTSLTRAHDRLEEELASRFHLKVSLADSVGKKLAEERDNLKKERDNLKKQVAALDQRARKSEIQRRQLLDSSSWRITAPLRKATGLLRRVRRRA